MILSYRKAEMMALKISLSVMLFTLLLYILGPIKWIEEWNYYEIITLLLLGLYFTAFALGYLSQFIRSHFYTYDSGILNKDENDGVNERWLLILKYTIIINLILTVGNAFLYSGVSSISTLMNKMIEGLMSPETVYYSKNVTSRAGSIIVWISFIYSPLMNITTFMSVYLFKKLHWFYKVIVVFTFTIEIARWLSVGTNKGLFDIVLLFLTYFIIIRMRFYSYNCEYKIRNKRQLRRIFGIVIIVIIAFFSFFGTSISARVGGRYSPQYFQAFPYSYVPEGWRFFLEKFDSYLVQGYDNFEKIIENCHFKWTYGVGNSRFLCSTIDRVFDLDITHRTYPFQLEQFGVDALAQWHSAYAWFASDVSLIGVAFLMFGAGVLFARLVKDILQGQNPVSMTLFYLMILSIMNASCTNYVLAYTNGFMAFWVLLFIHYLRRRKIIFKFNGKNIINNKY